MPKIVNLAEKSTRGVEITRGDNPHSITGRDGYLVLQALAYTPGPHVGQLLHLLLFLRQAFDRKDCDAAYYLLNARSHITGISWGPTGWIENIVKLQRNA